MILSHLTQEVIGKMFVQKPFGGIPGPQTGIALVQHIKGMDEVLKRYRELNGKEIQDQFTKEVGLYIKCVEVAMQGILVLSILPIAGLEAILARRADEDKDKKK